MTHAPDDPTRNDSSDRSGVAIPPPALFLLGLIAGFLTHRIAPIPIMPDAPARAIGLAITLLALLIMFWAMTAMHRARTTHSVFKPTTSIVRDGPFRFSRNPIYIGLTLIYAGSALIANGWWVLIPIVAVLAAIERLVIVREERYLERKFGDAYRAYKASVRRWL